MPTSIVITPELVAVSALPFALAGAAWAIKRWIGKVERKLDSLTSTVGDLKLKGAVSDERFSGLIGALDTQLKITQSQTKDVGRIAGSVEKLWAVLSAKGLLDPRLSDDLNGNGK